MPVFVDEELLRQIVRNAPGALDEAQIIHVALIVRWTAAPRAAIVKGLPYECKHRVSDTHRICPALFAGKFAP